MFGYGGEASVRNSNSEDPQPNDKVILNLTISQQQIQQITQTINLSQYDSEVQVKVQELLEELKKEEKNKPKIISIVKWLVDKGADALIAILLAAAHVV